MWGTTLLFQCCALRKFHVTGGGNMRNQIMRCKRLKGVMKLLFLHIHSFLVKSKQMLATYL